MKSAYIAFGTNIEPRENYLIKGLEQLKENEAIQLRNISSIYETDPVDFTDQADFLNLVVEVRTSLTAQELLQFCQEIESAHGRTRTIRFGPRTLDLDILIYENEQINTKDLIVPHPRMHERGFVLVPLNELNEELLVPGKDKTVKALLDTLPEDAKQGIHKWPRSKTNRTGE